MDQPDEDDDVTQRPLDSVESTTPKQCKRPASEIADEDKEKSATGVENAIPCGQDRDEQGSGTSSAPDNVPTLPLQDIDSGPSSKRPKMKMPSTGKRRFVHSNSPKGCSLKGSVVEATMDADCLPKNEACHSVSEFYKRIMVFNRPQLPGFDELNTFEEYLSSNPKCPICFDDISMLVIPRCKCHMLCCHSCMFKHLEYSYSRRQKYLCPFCRSPIGTLFFNIKSQSNYRLLNVPRNGQLRPLHRVIKSIGLIVSENSADCAVNPLSRITYATFLSAFECPSEAYLRFRNRSTEPTHWFRAFVYLNDLHPWNYTSAQCTLPVPLYSYQVGEQLTRLKDFLCAEVCYLINSLDIMPLDYAIIKKMNDLMVAIRFLVADMCPSVHDYFKIGTRFIKALNEILPPHFGAFLNSYNVSIGIKMYTESLYFLNSGALTIDTYIKRVIYTNELFGPSHNDPFTSRSEARALRNCLLKSCTARAKKKIKAHKRTLRHERLDELRGFAVLRNGLPDPAGLGINHIVRLVNGNMNIQEFFLDGDEDNDAADGVDEENNVAGEDDDEGEQDESQNENDDQDDDSDPDVDAGEEEEEPRAPRIRGHNPIWRYPHEPRAERGGDRAQMPDVLDFMARFGRIVERSLSRSMAEANSEILNDLWMDNQNAEPNEANPGSSRDSAQPEEPANATFNNFLTEFDAELLPTLGGRGSAERRQRASRGAAANESNRGSSTARPPESWSLFEQVFSPFGDSAFTSNITRDLAQPFNMDFNVPLPAPSDFDERLREMMEPHNRHPAFANPSEVDIDEALLELLEPEPTSSASTVSSNPVVEPDPDEEEEAPQIPQQQQLDLFDELPDEIHIRAPSPRRHRHRRESNTRKKDNWKSHMSKLKKLQKRSTECADGGPSYRYFLKSINHNESDGDSESEDDFLENLQNFQSSSVGPKRESRRMETSITIEDRGDRLAQRLKSLGYIPGSAPWNEKVSFSFSDVEDD